VTVKDCSEAADGSVLLEDCGTLEEHAAKDSSKQRLTTVTAIFFKLIRHFLKLMIFCFNLIFPLFQMSVDAPINSVEQIKISKIIREYTP